MKRDTILRSAILATALLLLEVFCRLEFIDPLTMVPPSRIFTRLIELTGQAEFWTQASATIRNMASATVISWVAGFVLGIVLHNMPSFRRSVEPLIASYYALPFFVFYPLAVVVLGMNDGPIILMAALFAVVSMVAGTLAGLDRIPVVLVKTIKAHNLGAIRASIFVLLPAVLPQVFAGMKLALGYSVAGVIAAEFILASSGLGYSIAFAYNAFDTQTMYAYIVFVILLVSIILAIVGLSERQLRYRAASNWTVVNKSNTEQSTSKKIFDWLLIFGLLLVIWQLLHMLAGGEALASPVTTWRRLVALTLTERFWIHSLETSRALVLSFALSILIGISLAVIFASWRRVGQICEPFVIGLQSIPKVTLYPIILLLFGLGLSAKVAFGVLHGFIPMTLIALGAMRSINPALIRTTRVLRMTAWQRISTVQVPAVLPDLVTGIRLAFSITFLGVMVGELFASKRGLGFLIMNSIAVNDVATIMAVTAVVGSVALLTNVLLLTWEDHMHR
jgi:NitT/TauT family transport system permease protein